MYETQFPNKDESKEPSLKDVLIKLADNMDEKKKKKKEPKFFLPFSAKINNFKLKNNYATIMKINENGHIKFTREQIEDQTIMLDGVPRLVGGGDVLMYKGKPLIIQPSWSVTPFSHKEEAKKSLEDGSNTAGYRLLMAKMEQGQIETKKKFNIGWGWIIGLIALGVVAYVLLK